MSPESGAVTVGIDPGATGAIACLAHDGALLWVEDMPYADGHVLAPILARIVLRSHEAHRHAIVERAQAMPGQGIASTFRYGAGYGAILGVLGALDIPLVTVHPGVWKRGAGLHRDKGASRRRAVELWPDHADLFARVKDDGRAEAALIARHGWATRHKGAA